MRRREKPPNPTYGVDLLGCDLRTWTRNVAYRVPLQVPNRGTGTTVLTYHLGFGIKPTHRGIWLPVLATHTSQNLVYNTESASLGPPVIDQLNGCMSAPFQTCRNTVVVVRVTSLLNKSAHTSRLDDCANNNNQ